MKKSITLLIMLVLASMFAHAQGTYIQKVRTTSIGPNTQLPAQKTGFTNYFSRSNEICDTLMLDYSTYDETIALNNNLNWNGLGIQTPTGFLNSFIDSDHVGDNAFIAGIFDTLVYTNGSQTVGYIPLSTSTIYLDSVGVLLQLIGPLSNMLHDSIVFSIYSIGTVGTTLVKNIVYGDTSKLSAFIPSTNYIPYNVIPVGVQLTEGEGFAVGITYLNKVDTSYLAYFYSYADSCGTPTVTINDQEETLNSAYPSSLGAITDFAITLPGNSGYVSSTTNNLDFGYFTLESAPNFLPANCAYFSLQDLVMYPIINVCTSTLGITEVKSMNDISIAASPNPFTNATNISIQGLSEKYDFELYDVTGRLYKSIVSLNTDHLLLSREDLASGIYFYRIVTSSGKSVNGNLVIE